MAGAEKTYKVEVFVPKVVASDRALALPGTVKALEETQIYARTTGYVRAWHVDIGDKVDAGALLAELDTPDLDAQLAQARAQLAQAKAAVAQAIANRDYSKSNSTRYETLANQQLVSKGSLEQTQAQAASDAATVDAAKSNVVAQEANVRRLVDTQVFSKVTAPFAGKITVRNVERGALVHDTSTVPMFVLVATDPVRVSSTRRRTWRRACARIRTRWSRCASTARRRSRARSRAARRASTPSCTRCRRRSRCRTRTAG